MVSSFLLFVAACSNSPEGPPAENPTNGPSSTPVYDYEGPPVVADLELDGAQRVLRVDVTVPSGGFELAVDSVDAKDGPCIVKLKLTEPGDDEINTQALVTHTQRIAAPQGARSFKVQVARWKRGVQYLVEPEHKLAKLVLSK